MQVTFPQAEALSQVLQVLGQLEALHWFINIMQIKAINIHKVVLSADSLIKQHKLMQKREVFGCFFFSPMTMLCFCFILLCFNLVAQTNFSGERMLWHGETTVQPQQGKTEKHLAQ